MSTPTKIVNLSRHIYETQRRQPSATGEFSDLLMDLALACKLIQAKTRKAGLLEVLGVTDDENVHGETVKKLDAIADDIIYRAMDHGGHLCAMASEENEEVLKVPPHYEKGKYVLLFDPLDGSSNIDANVSVGTIFSIHRRTTAHGTDGTLRDCLQPGYKQVCAGYVIYGSSTVFVYTTGHGVHGFTYDPSVGEFLLSHEDIKIPEKGKLFSINDGNWAYWDTSVRQYIRYITAIGEGDGRPYSSRYIGSLVADFHRNLLYGGIFLYPADSKSPRNANGKLRLLYEAAPLAFIVEQAGGKASDGHRRIMDIEPEQLHQRVPLIIGSRQEVELYEEFAQGTREFHPEIS